MTPQTELIPIAVNDLDVSASSDASALVAELLAAAVEDLGPVYLFLRESLAEAAPRHATAIAIVMASLAEASMELQQLD